MKPGELTELTKTCGFLSKARKVIGGALGGQMNVVYKAGRGVTKSEIGALKTQLGSKAHVTPNVFEQNRTVALQAGVDIGRGIRRAAKNPAVKRIIGEKASKGVSGVGKTIAGESVDKMRQARAGLDIDMSTKGLSKAFMGARGAARKIPKPVRKTVMKYKRRMGGTSASAQLATSRPVINLPPGAPPEVAAHELGHASGPLRRTRAVVPGLLMKSKKPMVQAVGKALRLGEEAQASVRGYKAMKGAGTYSKKELSKAKKNLGSAFATYLGGSIT
jgi:hypothetical protein